MRVTTASRKKRSCETRITACGYAFRYSSSQLRASRSRWLVGSSSSSRFGLAEQQLRERDPHLPAAGEGFGRPLEIRGAEAEALQHRRRLQARCCSRRAGGSGPAGRCSVRASRRARPRGSTDRRAAPRARASRPSSRAARRTRCWPPRRRSGRRASGRPAAGSRRSARPASGWRRESGSSRPAIIRSSVVLPAPFGPHRPTRSPS